MKRFDPRLSIKIDFAAYNAERSRGLIRLFWRLMLVWQEWRAMG